MPLLLETNEIKSPRSPLEAEGEGSVLSTPNRAPDTQQIARVFTPSAYPFERHLATISPFTPPCNKNATGLKSKEQLSGSKRFLFTPIRYCRVDFRCQCEDNVQFRDDAINSPKPNPEAIIQQKECEYKIDNS